MRWSSAPRSSRAWRMSPAVTSSQRQTVVSSSSHSDQPDGTGCARCIARANARPRRIARRSRSVRRGSGGRPASSAAVRAASSPSRTARRAPPTPVASPATYTPAWELRCRSSTQATREPSTSSRVSAPAARTSSSEGVKPQPSAHEVDGELRSVPATGRPCRSTRAMVTAVDCVVPVDPDDRGPWPVRDTAAQQRCGVSGALDQLGRCTQDGGRTTEPRARRSRPRRWRRP